MPSTRQLKLQQDRLWSDHYYLTREVIRDAVNSDSCLSVDLEALYQNQRNLGRNFGRLTSNSEARTRLTQELTYHIDIAVEIVTLAIQGQSIDEAYARWKENARQIAKVYHKYNRSIDFKKMNNEMQMHLKTTLDEAVAIVQKNCAESQVKGQIALEHIHHMSDYIMSKF